MSSKNPKNDGLRSDLATNMGETEPNPTENKGFSVTETQANFSAMLYVITEQQALIGKLLEVLLNNNAISSHQLEAITGIYGDTEVLSPVYAEVYKRFAWYFLTTKEILEKEKSDLAKNSAEDPDYDG